MGPPTRAPATATEENNAETRGHFRKLRSECTSRWRCADSGRPGAQFSRCSDRRTDGEPKRRESGLRARSSGTARGANKRSSGAGRPGCWALLPAAGAGVSRTPRKMAAAPPKAPCPLTEKDRREVRGRATAGKKLSGPSGHPRAAPAPPPPHRPSRPRAGGRRGWAEHWALPRPRRRRPPQVARRERCPRAVPHPSRRGAAPRQRPPGGAAVSAA